MEHYFLAASNADVWGNCPGAAQMAAVFPQLPDDDSRLGDSAHWYAAESLLGRAHAEGEAAPNGVILTDETIECAEVYTDAVRSRLASGCVWGVEHRGQAIRIHHEHCGGTTDNFIWEPSRRYLTVLDYKHGHAQVDPDTLQLIVYAAMLLEKLGLTGHDEQFVTVELVIVQPRCFTAGRAVRSVKMKAADLRPEWNKLHHSAELALQPGAPTVTGEHCFYCPARHACDAHRRAVLRAVDVVGRADVQPATPESVAYELQLLDRVYDLVRSRKKAKEAEAEQMLRAGVRVPGYGMEPKESRLEWLPSATSETLKAMDPRLVKDKPLTPLQAAKLLGWDKDTTAKYAKRETSMVLARQDGTQIRRVLSAAAQQ